MNHRASPAHRNDILNAVEQLLARDRYGGLRVENVVRAAGVGKGTFYVYFDSKEAAVLATVDRIVESVCEEMTRIAGSAASAPERLTDMLLARILIRFDRVSLYQSSLNDLLSAVRPALLERRRRHFERESEILALVLSAGVSGGEFRPGDPKQLAGSMLLATNTFLPYALSAQELGNRLRLERDARGVIALLVAGVVQ
jgi:AcrR family transcriptional regulator